MNQLNTWYKLLPPALRTLLTINVVLFVLWIPLSISQGVNEFFHQHLTLQAAGYQAFKEPWQFITYNFLHIKGSEFQGLISLAIGMMFLVAVGRDYEEMHGSHRLFAVYIIGGVGGGILAITLKGLFPELLQAQTGLLMVSGSMSAVLAIMMAVAILHPYKSIALLLIGPVKLLYLVIGYLVFDTFVFSNGEGATIYAHWGGALFGFLFAKAESSNIDLSSWALYFFPRSTSGRSGGGKDPDGFLSKLESWLAAKNPDEVKKKPSPKQKPTKERSWRRAETAEVEIVETSMEGEVDRILDKISAEGYDSLTAEEKRILYEASKR